MCGGLELMFISGCLRASRRKPQPLCIMQNGLHQYFDKVLNNFMTNNIPSSHNMASVHLKYKVINLKKTWK